MAHEHGARCGGGRWLLSIVLILTSIMNGSGEYGDVYKYNSTFSLSEYWRIFTSYTNLGFTSVCILVNIRQYSLRLHVLLYTHTSAIHETQYPFNEDGIA